MSNIITPLAEVVVNIMFKAMGFASFLNFGVVHFNQAGQGRLAIFSPAGQFNKENIAGDKCFYGLEK